MLHRRKFLAAGAAVATSFAASDRPAKELATQVATRRQPVWAIIPVVGDGKWIWTQPPAGDTGYLEPRPYELKVGIEIEGAGPAANLRATTAAPVELSEQEVMSSRVEMHGCRAGLRQLSASAGQLALTAPSIRAGQRISAVAHYRLTLYKRHDGFERRQFAREQSFPAEFRKQYLYDSPGIQTRLAEVRKLAAELSQGLDHPWDQAAACHRWVWENIQGRPQAYTSVREALRERVGDCEERAAVFIALCRAAGIPARLVWVPNHNWAEFCLRDHEGTPHWIPAHTSAYSWFGWTGAHELVLQKGDSVQVPEQRKPLRLLADWMQWQGRRPKVRYGAELTPLPFGESQEAGPGWRRKNERGEWARVGQHPLDAYLRDGERASETPPDSAETANQADSAADVTRPPGDGND